VLSVGENQARLAGGVMPVSANVIVISILNMFHGSMAVALTLVSKIVKQAGEF
jgi:5-bromo-4-chloroindolyl phosphate hydrolysis protein